MDDRVIEDPLADVKIGGDVKAALAIATLLTFVGAALSNAAATILLVPLVFVILVYVMSRVPLRHSMMAMAFFAVTLENVDESSGAGVFKSPLYSVGTIFLSHWNAIDRSIGFLSAFAFSGIDLCLVALGIIAFQRRSNGSKIDKRGRIPTPKPLIRLAYLSLAATLFVWVNGLLRGGTFNMSLWQIQRVIYLPIVFLLFNEALRGPKDHGALARVLLTAATIRAVAAVYIMKTVRWKADPTAPGEGEQLPFATSHHDSILFAAAFVLLVAFLLERVGRKTKRLPFLLLPVLTAGMIANNRRMAWVQVAMVLITVFFVTPDNPIKRRIRRAITVLVPLVAGYVLVGWNSGSRVFKPVQMMRSVIDSKSDASTMWREIENFDIISTAKMNPILGSGYGRPWIEFVKLPHIDYDLEQYIPHNSVLGLWCYGGYVGFTAMTLLWIAGVYLAVRAYHAAKEPSHRVAAVVCFGVVLIYMIQCWGDMGLGASAGVFCVGPVLAVAGKLAVATGAWGKKKVESKAITRAVAPPGADRAQRVA